MNPNFSHVYFAFRDSCFSALEVGFEF